MTLGSWRYYNHELSVEDYYLGQGKEPGVWVGSGAAGLGLSGRVEDGQLARLFDEGRHPLSAVPLGVPYRHDSKRTVVTGYALSFSPPKSVSLVGAFGGAEVAGEVRAAHDAAVHAALGFLEEHAAFSRRGRGGVIQVDTEGFVAAAFTHQTSRAGDPQLHSHVLVANKVRCADGRWRSLDGRELFAFQKAAGMLYNAALRVELSARLGVAWDPVDRNGQADIDGMPRALIELFSKRRREVERRGVERIAAAEARLGRTLTDDERAEQYQFATYETRPAKAGHEDETVRSGRWRVEADAAGLVPERWLDRTLDRDLAIVRGVDCPTWNWSPSWSVNWALPVRPGAGRRWPRPRPGASPPGWRLTRRRGERGWKRPARRSCPIPRSSRWPRRCQWRSLAGCAAEMASRAMNATAPLATPPAKPCDGRAGSSTCSSGVVMPAWPSPIRWRCNGRCAPSASASTRPRPCGGCAWGASA